MAISFKEKLKVVSGLIADGTLKPLLSLRHSGYLVDTGWFNSYKTREAVDGGGNPIPWMTYPFIDFITGRLNRDLTVFEYGSGSSTLFFASAAASVHSVEQDELWYNKISARLPANAVISLVKDNYASSVKQKELKYDIVIIDAEERNECIYSSVGSLSDRGVLILDDAEREEYTEAVKFLLERGFRKLDFWGMAPSVMYRKLTSVFYREGNCLNI